MRSSMKRLISLGLLAALPLLGAGAVIGAQAPLRAAGVLESARLHGYLSAVHFRPLDLLGRGCDDVGQQLSALQAYGAQQGVFASLVEPRAAFAAPRGLRCAVLKTLFRIPNLIINEGETGLRDCFNANAGSACTGTVAVWKFHGLGTNATAAAETDTGCGTELTTQYNPNSTRATGSQATNGTNVYRTIGTNTVDEVAAVTEWCLEAAATGASTTWSHIVFSTINLAASDSLQTTYDLTIE